MPLYLIERNFAEQINATRDVATAITQVNADAGIQWLFSFLSATRGRPTACMRRPTLRPSVKRRGS
jgi:hypothetical protein